jgi:hypothetical protein
MRAIGFYWVKTQPAEDVGDCWVVGEWDGVTWHLPGVDQIMCSDDNFIAIDERRLVRRKVIPK